ncbi:TRAF-type zinc finger domain-containing protein 1 isoform X2 [Tamandua tetradactyla]|uniref:TRAF-type zinc finger domain-containing protein 1 isoform X2 n=1 Tax=Tamandua tetradactyla TaxID=48850 RepID=UPI0040549329
MAEFIHDQDTQLCDNCKKEIPVFNFTIHEIHCQRNIGVCPVCKEPFPKSDMETHMATEHCQVTCKCNQKLEKRQLKKHEETECPLRLALCQHCDLELSVLKLKDHEDYCGARTELCGSFEEQERQERNRSHQLPKESGEDSANLDFMLALSLQNEGQVPNMAEQSFWKAICEADQPHGEPSALSDIKGAADETMLPCEFCEELYPEELLIDHQTSCNPSCALPLLSTGSSSPRGVEDPDVIFQKFLQQAENNQLDSLMGLTNSPPMGDSIIIPCEFCGVQLEEEVLFHHQDQCDQRPITANSRVTEGFPSQDTQLRETSPELPRRRVRHQGDLSSGCMDDIKQETAKGRSYPLSPSRPINNVMASCNRLSKSSSSRPGCQPSPPRVLKLNNSDSQDIRGRNQNSHSGSMATGHISVIHPIRNVYPENVVPSYPRGPAGRYGVSARSEGGRNSRVTSMATSYRNRTAKAKPPKQQGAGDVEEEEEEE